MIEKKTKAARGMRSPVTPTEIKGTLGDAGAVLVWNISERGLCVWVTAKIKKGDVVTLSLTMPLVIAIECQVRWCRSVPDRSGFLIGLEVVDPEALSEVHRTVARSRSAS